MLKRILYISFIIILVGALTYFYVQVNQHSEVEINSKLLDVLPNNAGLIIELSHLDQIKNNEDADSSLWSNLTKIQPFNDFFSYYQQWDSIAQENSDLLHWDASPAILSYHLLGQKTNTFFALQSSNKANVKAWTSLLSNTCKLEKTYNNINIYKTNAANMLYVIVYKNYLAVSNTPILLEQSIRHLQNPTKDDEHLLALRSTKGAESLANVFINYDRFQSIVEALSHNNSPISQKLRHLGTWGEFDFSITDNQIIMNGFSSYNKEDYWQLFAQQENSKLSILDAIPSSNEGFVILSPTNIKAFRSAFESYLNNTGQLVEYNSYWNTVEKRGGAALKAKIDQLVYQEMALTINTTNNKNVLIIKTESQSKTKQELIDLLSVYYKAKGQKLSSHSGEIHIDNATSYDYYSFPFKDSFGYLYGKVFKNFEANYVAQYDDYLIFSTQKEALKSTLKAYVLKQTFANDKAFQSIYRSFASKSSVFYFGKMMNILSKLEANTTPEFCQENNITDQSLNHFYAIVYQMVNSEKYIYNSILCQYNPELKAKPTTEWTSLLDAAPIGKPTLVKNHYTQENEICIQDALNNLYLISNSGRIIWKKAIGENIISDIHQIDYYKNGKLQLLFNTRNKLWLLDRDGNFVERYPILLSSPATTGLSLFDYDQNRNYRIFIPTQDNKINLFNADGNINTGFKFKGTEEIVNTPIQYFRIAGKDYIITSDKNRVYILNRRGQERIKLKEQFSASSQNQFFIGKDEHYYFATTDQQGALKKIYLDGSVRTLEFNKASEKHYFALDKIDKSNNDNYIIVDQGIINVYNFRGRLLYSKEIENSILSRPYFYRFSSNDIKMGITDIMNNKIYLLNGKDGSYYEGFPLVGTSPFTIGLLKASSWRFNLIVGGENDALYNYKVK